MLGTRRCGTFFFLLFFQTFYFSFASARVDAVLGSVELQLNPNLPGFLPTTANEEIILSRKQYVISYNKTRREPNWVAWKIELSDLGDTPRENNFSVDVELDSYLKTVPGAPPAVQENEYRGSCFDRGHQSPSGDHTASAEDNRATFLMSNMIPQTAFLNRGIWEHLESYTRTLVRKDGKKVYAVAGPIYDENFGAIGPHDDIPVPSKNFKMLIVLDASQTPDEITSATAVIAVIMPNTLSDGSAPTDHDKLCHTVEPADASAVDWRKYSVPVEQIESLSGIRLHKVKNVEAPERASFGFH